MNKTNQKKLYTLLINNSPLAVAFKPGSPEQDFAILVCRDLPLVYAELPEAKFCVLNVNGHRSTYRCLHIWKTNKWVPITASKVFATKGGGTPAASKKKRVLAAMRLVIKPQIEDFKAQVVLPMTCPLSGKTLNTLNGRYVHVDHGKRPFSLIVSEWLKLKRLSFEEIALNRAGDFSSDTLRVDFYNYHKTMADLQLVDKTANLIKGART
jgi:hypothetical protein